ncbi:hypothetical protein CPB83DRAFT_211061, partial [Crepidotus variabilis]
TLSANITSQQTLTFDQLLQESELPLPGPEYYEARRKLWLTPRPSPPTPPSVASDARERLEEILSQPNAVYNREVWNNGLEKVWKGLSSGGKLKTRLPMNMIIKIVHASWLRDRTWPAGMRAPSSDDDQPQTTTGTNEIAPIASTSSIQADPSDLSEELRPMPTIATSELLELPSPRKINNRHYRGR